MELAEIFSNGFTNYSYWCHRDEAWCNSFSLNQRLSICNRNLNVMSVYMNTKLAPLSAHISAHKFNIICRSETYLNFKTPSDGYEYIDT